MLPILLGNEEDEQWTNRRDKLLTTGASGVILLTWMKRESKFDFQARGDPA
jgi:hypothetical protein